MKKEITNPIILVPTDFSPSAKNAADYALAFAKDLKAELLLIHVYQLPLVDPDMPISYLDFTEFEHINEDLLKSEVKRLKKQHDSEIRYVSKSGFLVHEILLDQAGINCIVMGMQGSDALSDLFTGSVSTAVMRKAMVPVLIIPGQTRYKKINQIVLACDYKPDMNLRILNPLLELAEMFEAEIHMLSIKTEGRKLSDEERETALLIDKKLKHIKHHQHVEQHMDFILGINQYIEEQRIDLLAVIPHYYNFFERLFHKSITKRLAFHTSIPILSLPELPKEKVFFAL